MDHARRDGGQVMPLVAVIVALAAIGVLLLGRVGEAQTARARARTAAGDPTRSPFVRATSARSVKVRLDRKVRYELDGGDRTKVKAFEVEVEPGALRICVPRRPNEGGG